MNNTDEFYVGCPVQHARQFLAGKWQIGILWYLKDGAMRFGEIKTKLPGLSDKILMQELDFFLNKKIIQKEYVDLAATKAEYSLAPLGRSLIPVINSIVEWGYLYLQDEQVNQDMSLTPLPAIEAIESSITGTI